MSQLNQNQQDTCIYTGIFGAMLGATTLVQHVMITKQHWITFALLFIYLISIITFIMLATQKHYAPLLLIVSTALVFVAEAFLIISGLFSLIVLLLFTYSVVMIVILYVGEYPQKLRGKEMARRAEELAWRERI